MARRRKRKGRKHWRDWKFNLPLLDDKTIADKKRGKLKERREPGLLTQEEIEELRDWLLSLEKTLLDGIEYLSSYVTDANEAFGLEKRGRMSQEEIDELLAYMLKQEGIEYKRKD